MTAKISKDIKLFIMLGFMANMAFAADVMTGVSHNPFKAPDLQGVGAISSSVTGLSEPTGVEINLRAILLDGKESLVQVGGELIGIGEMVQGYKLIAVHGDSADFIKQGKQIRVSIYDDKDGQGDE